MNKICSYGLKHSLKRMFCCIGWHFYQRKSLFKRIGFTKSMHTYKSHNERRRRNEKTRFRNEPEKELLPFNRLINDSLLSTSAWVLDKSNLEFYFCFIEAHTNRHHTQWAHYTTHTTFSACISHKTHTTRSTWRAQSEHTIQHTLHSLHVFHTKHTLHALHIWHKQHTNYTTHTNYIFYMHFTKNTHYTLYTYGTHTHTTHYIDYLLYT